MFSTIIKKERSDIVEGIGGIFLLIIRTAMKRSNWMLDLEKSIDNLSAHVVRMCLEQRRLEKLE